MGLYHSAALKNISSSQKYHLHPMLIIWKLPLKVVGLLNIYISLSNEESVSDIYES